MLLRRLTNLLNAPASKQEQYWSEMDVRRTERRRPHAVVSSGLLSCRSQLIFAEVMMRHVTPLKAWFMNGQSRAETRCQKAHLAHDPSTSPNDGCWRILMKKAATPGQTLERS